MRNRRTLLLPLAACVLAVLVAFAYLNRVEEPSYQGRSLSDWLFEISDPKGAVGGPQGVMQRTAVVRHFGTNSIPWLVEYAKDVPPAWRVKLHIAEAALGRWLGRDWSRSREITRIFYRDYGALHALAILGPDAESAIPDLVLLAENRNQYDPMRNLRATYALAFLGPKAVPPLHKILTNQHGGLRFQGGYSFGVPLGPDARAAMPVWQTLLEDPDAEVRKATTNVLLKLAPEVLTDAPPR